MNFYVDTSVVVSALTPEVASHQSRLWLGAQSPGSIAISPWVETEFQSALSLKVRTGRLTIEEKIRIAAYFRARLFPKFRMIAVESEDFAFAANSFENNRLALRAGDALHLAIAARNGLAISSNDRQMLDAAAVLQIACIEPSKA